MEQLKISQIYLEIFQKFLVYRKIEFNRTILFTSLKKNSVDNRLLKKYQYMQLNIY